MSVTVAERRKRFEGKVSTDQLDTLASFVNGPDGWVAIAFTDTGAYVQRAGYAVSVHPERGQRIGDAVTGRDLLAYVRAHWDLLGKSGAVLRVRRARNGCAYLDVSTVVHDRERARVLGRAHGQARVLDLMHGCAVRT